MVLFHDQSPLKLCGKAGLGLELAIPGSAVRRAAKCARKPGFWRTEENFPLIIIKHPWYEPRYDKTNNVAVRPAKTQISLGIRPVWSESSLCTEGVAKDPSFLHGNSEYSDQTGRMPWLICVFAGRTLILLVFSCRGSYLFFWLFSLEEGLKWWLKFFYYHFSVICLFGN